MKKNITGFTLIELMIVLAIAAILAAMAAPSFTSTIKNNRINTQLRSFSDYLKLARSEAVSSQRTVAICHLDSSNVCDANWSSGWTVFYDDDLDSTLNAPAADTLKVHDGVGGNVLTVFNSVATPVAQSVIVYNNQGALEAGSGLTVKLCDVDQAASYARALIVSASGMAVNSRINSASNVYKDIAGVDLTCP